MLRGTIARTLFLCILAVGAVACKEEGGIRFSSFTFNYFKAVTPAQLNSAPATSASSKLPWGTKHYFSRSHLMPI